MLEVDGIEIDRTAESSVRIIGSRVVHIDPWRLDGELESPANLVLITHEHEGHFSVEDLRHVVGPKTSVACPAAVAAELEDWQSLDLDVLQAGDTLTFGPLHVRAVAAYSDAPAADENLPGHPRAAGGLGYVVEMDGVRVYHAGDTGLIPDMRGLGTIDVALLPVAGGTIMSPADAAEAGRLIDPGIIVPIHYGATWGTVDDAYELDALAGRRVEII